jgi:hypothetical protein
MPPSSSIVVVVVVVVVARRPTRDATTAVRDDARAFAVRARRRGLG